MGELAGRAVIDGVEQRLQGGAWRPRHERGNGTARAHLQGPCGAALQRLHSRLQVLHQPVPTQCRSKPAPQQPHECPVIALVLERNGATM